MSRDELIAMAREADPFGDDGRLVWLAMLTPETLERFAALVAEADRSARIAAQTEAAELKERLARSGVEQRRAVREAVLAEREACAALIESTTERSRWIRGGINGTPIEPCQYAAAIRARGTP